MEQKELIEVAVKIAMKLIKPLEGCVLNSYPDPASDLSKALARNNMLQKYISGKIELPDNFKNLNGSPYTIGYGETKGISPGMKWTQEQAESALASRVREFAEKVIKVSPVLATQPAERLAACTSLAYNIGMGNPEKKNGYTYSTVARCVANKEWTAAAEAFKLFNKGNGQVMRGLVIRRQAEADLFLSVKG